MIKNGILLKPMNEIDLKALGFVKNWEQEYFDIEKGKLIPSHLKGYKFQERIYIDLNGHVKYFFEDCKAIENCLGQEDKWNELLQKGILKENEVSK